jgi:hypothetical protein
MAEHASAKKGFLLLVARDPILIAAESVLD